MSIRLKHGNTVQKYFAATGNKNECLLKGKSAQIAACRVRAPKFLKMLALKIKQTLEMRLLNYFDGEKIGPPSFVLCV